MFQCYKKIIYEKYANFLDLCSILRINVSKSSSINIIYEFIYCVNNNNSKLLFSVARYVINSFYSVVYQPEDDL